MSALGRKRPLRGTKTFGWPDWGLGCVCECLLSAKSGHSAGKKNPARDGASCGRYNQLLDALVRNVRAPTPVAQPGLLRYEIEFPGRIKCPILQGASCGRATACIAALSVWLVW